MEIAQTILFFILRVSACSKADPDLWWEIIVLDNTFEQSIFWLFWFRWLSKHHIPQAWFSACVADGSWRPFKKVGFCARHQGMEQSPKEGTGTLTTFSSLLSSCHRVSYFVPTYATSMMNYLSCSLLSQNKEPTVTMDRDFCKHEHERTYLWFNWFSWESRYNNYY